MPKYHIPVLIEVETTSMEEARVAAYRMIDALSFKGFHGGSNGELTPAELIIADDSATDKLGYRYVKLHPATAFVDCDEEELEKQAELKEDSK